MVSVVTNSSNITLPMSYEDTASIITYMGKPKRWKDLRPLEKILVFVVAAVLVVTLALIIAVAVMGAKLSRLEESQAIQEQQQGGKNKSSTLSPRPTGGPGGTTSKSGVTTSPFPGKSTTPAPAGRNNNVCDETECVIAAGEILRIMDLSIDPCKNFFHYACGNWEEKNPIPDSKMNYDQSDLLKDKITRHNHGILQIDPDESSDPEPVRMAQKFYDECVAQKSKLFSTGNENYSVVKEFLEHLLADFDTDVWKTLGHLRRALGGNYLFTLNVDMDAKNASRNAIYLDQPIFGVPRSHLVSRNVYHDHYVETYQGLIEDIWMKIFEDRRHVEAAENVVHMERLLAEITSSPEERQNKSSLYNPHTVKELYDLTDSENSVTISWDSYFEEVFFDIYDPEKKGLTWNKTNVVVRDVHFFHMMETVLAGEKNKTMQILRDFLTWKIIFDFAEDINNELRDLLFEFHTVTEGLETPEPLWKMCTEQTQEYFGMALSYHFIQHYFDEDYKKEATDLLDDIKNSLKKTLSAPGDKELGWMSAQSKLRAINKLDKLHAFVGHPDWLMDGGNISNKPLLITELDEYYYHLQLDKDNDHFDNMVEVLEWESRENLKLFANPRNRDRWSVDPISVLALYWPVHNSISLPAGILQHPFYGAPVQYLNYGAAGSLIGHALIHSFDFKGKQYNADGTLNKWWDAETERNYAKKTECFMNKFKNYTSGEESIPIHWKQSMLDESLAENLGLKLAYRAYKSHVKTDGEEHLLPGFNATANQLFFLSYAQMWCSAFRNEVSASAKNEWYTPSQFRESGGLHGSVDFARAWSCPLPPVDANCNIWSA